ncbi:MAG: hypothetical protein WD071_06915 [Pseudohongiella sp.]|uniref:hypothetical protein n=1 Tax=Pseudohongiella sp. TaxID=1979412 RepID=UPI0034A06612
MRFNFLKKNPEHDWVKFFGDLPPATKKSKLIEICGRKDVSIYADDSTENAHTPLRAVASEAELERRLLAKMSVSYSLQSRRVAIAALIVAIGSLILEFFGMWNR